MNKNLHYELTRISIPFLVTIILASCSSLVWGKMPQTGSIRGKVVADIPDQRKPLSGVTVTLSSDRLGDKPIQTTTDMEGQYDFPNLVAGDYIVTVEFSGFRAGPSLSRCRARGDAQHGSRTSHRQPAST